VPSVEWHDQQANLLTDADTDQQMGRKLEGYCSGQMLLMSRLCSEHAGTIKWRNHIWAAFWHWLALVGTARGNMRMKVINGAGTYLWLPIRIPNVQLCIISVSY
jgi:hypothetical protein